MKAKELRPYAERLITLAKREDNRLHARRLVLRDIHDTTVVKKLFDTLGTRFATRPGGYTRILRLGPRKGDGAEMAIVELLGSEFQPGKKDEKAAEKGKAVAKAKVEPKDKDAKAAPTAKKAGEKKAAGKNKKESGGAKNKAAEE
jgi:large subunit ribosomal protein L17